MSPKNNDAPKEFNKILKYLTTVKGQTILTLQINDFTGKQTDAKPAAINNKNFLLKPIKNNTSIKASNKTCNLIGKMINDVSKTTIYGFSHCKQNDKTATETTTQMTTTLPIYETRSEGGTNITDDDFHSTTTQKNYTNNEQLKTISDAANEHQQKMSTNLNEVHQESLSATMLANSVGGLLTKQPQQQHNAESEVKGEFSVTVKPSLLQNFNNRVRHKNLTIIPFDDSYQRTTDLETSHNQCELLQFKRYPEKDLLNNNQTDSILNTLAERKALLKKEFFKDLTETTATNPQPQVKIKCLSTPLNKRILKKQHNLKLKIPKDTNKLQKVAKNLEVSQISFVALRKLDLQQKTQTKSCNNEAEKKILNSQFPSVKDLAKKFDSTNNMIVPQTVSSNKAEVKSHSIEQRHSPMSDEGCNLGHSPYSSDDDNDSIRTTHTAIERIPGNKNKDKVARSASSDSALGLEVDEPMDITEQQQQQQKRRMTLTVTDLPLRPALLPLAEPTLLPDSPTMDIPLTLPTSLQQSQVPTKVLLEERVVEIPEDPRSEASSRRESSQSCLSDYPANEMQGVRYVRTPSVVVSDYSDDITCGITLEEIEYFRAQRQRRRRSSLDTAGNEKDANDNNSDISASSSCSNLYYCGSTISALDGAECLVNGVRLQLERKTSDCSNCSISGDEDCSPTFTIPEQPEDCQDITDMLANQHLSNKHNKKVGISADSLTVDNPNFV